MKIKYLFIFITSLLLLVSLSQIFPIFPQAEDIEGLYKSGYFRGLERQCEVIRDSFTGIKTMNKPVYGWIYLDDLKNRHDIQVRIYDRNGVFVPVPGEKSGQPVDEIVKTLESRDSRPRSFVRKGKYFTIMAVKLEKNCYYCHDHAKNSEIAGVMTFEQDYDAHIYYSMERIIIFLAFSMILAAALFLLIRWEPVANIKEMFDKS